MIEGLPNADALGPCARLQAWLCKAAFVAALVALAGFAAGYLSGCAAA